MKADNITYLIDRAIKEVWKQEIVTDYDNDCILYEDSLKCVLYFHLRNKLSQLIADSNIRIYTEFNNGPLAGKGIRADLAIVKIDDSHDNHLRDRIIRVYALIELKHKGNSARDVFWHDIKKVLGLLKEDQLSDCQFYLGFIHEQAYDADADSWLTVREQSRAGGRLTELSACYYTDREDLWFTVVSHNGLNQELNDSFLPKRS